MTTARAPQGAQSPTLGSRHPIRLLGLDSDAIALLTTGENRYLAFSIPPHAVSGPAKPDHDGGGGRHIGDDPICRRERSGAVATRGVRRCRLSAHTGSVAGFFINPGGRRNAG